MSFEMVSRLITNLEKKPLMEDNFDSMLSLILTKKSSKEEVSRWLEEEGFILARDKLKGITGKELYSIPKEELRKMLGFAEAARLFSRLLKEKERLPVAEQTIKESDFERFMRIRREDVDSRIPNDPITTFSSPFIPPKPSRPMIREVFHEPEEPVRSKYAERVKKPKEKSSEKRSSKKPENVPSKEVSGKKDRRSKDRRERESPESEVSGSEEEDKRRRHKHKKEKKERKEKEEGKGRKDKHKRSHKSRQSSESSSSASESDESPDSPPRSSRHKSRRKERDRKKNQEKEKKKEEQTDPASSPPPPHSPHPYSLRPQLSPYAPMSPVSPLLTPHLPQYPSPFPDPYTNQLMMQQAQIARAEQDKFAAEMRLRQLKSGFGAPGALSFPPPMPYQNF